MQKYYYWECDSCNALNIEREMHNRGPDGDIGFQWSVDILAGCRCDHTKSIHGVMAIQAGTLVVWHEEMIGEDDMSKSPKGV